MAATAGTIALTCFRAAAGPAPGILEWKYTYSTTTYQASGTVDITSLMAKANIDPKQIVSVVWSVESSTAGYLTIWTPAATPGATNIGVIQLFTTTSAEASGSLTLVLRARAVLAGPGGAQANIMG